MGDKLLQSVAEGVRTGYRATPSQARLFGDEVIFVLPKTDACGAEQMIKRSKSMLLKEKADSIDSSVAFGCATKNAADENIQVIYKATEDDMYWHELSVYLILS